MPEILGITISFFCRVLSPCYLFNKYWTVTCNYSFIISFPFQFLNPAASMPWVISELTKMNFLPHAFACCTWWILNAFLIWLLLSTKEKLRVIFPDGWGFKVGELGHGHRGWNPQPLFWNSTPHQYDYHAPFLLLSLTPLAPSSCEFPFVWPANKMTWRFIKQLDPFYCRE